VDRSPDAELVSSVTDSVEDGAGRKCDISGPRDLPAIAELGKKASEFDCRVFGIEREVTKLNVSRNSSDWLPFKLSM
jgi:hypothetical protein